MRLEDLFSPIRNLSDDELKDRIRQIRHNREVARPVAKKVVAKQEKRENNKNVSALEKLLSKMSPEEIQTLLGGSND